MTAQTTKRMRSFERWGQKQFLLSVGHVAHENAIAAIDLTTGEVVEATDDTNLFVIGNFAESVDATSAAKLVNVRLPREIEVEWMANAEAGDAVAATDVGSLCYQLDDQTVTITPTGLSVAGRVWAVDATHGVAVEKLQAVPAPIATLEGLPLVEDALDAFAAAAIVVADNPDSGTVYDVPTTAANSTITLPATAVEGTKLYFVADGTKNGHTVQYKDATGPTNITAALTASKRHLVTAVFLNSKWYAAAVVGP